MIKRYKSVFIGLGVFFYNIGVSFAPLVKIERCNGNCGSCGAQCVAPIAGLLTIGGMVYLRKTMVRKFKRVKLG